MEKRKILVKVLQDLDIRDDDRLIELRKGKEVEIPFRFFKGLIELKVVVPGGMQYGPSVRMDS